MKKIKLIRWICIGSFIISCVIFGPKDEVKADFWGGDLPLLAQILAKSIEQIAELQQIIGASRDTVSLLEEMDKGVKDILRLAETAHIPLPKQVYDDAKTLDRAVGKAETVYGVIRENSPIHQQVQFRSGTEGLFLSQDAFDYSTELDKAGDKIKSAAIVSNQPTAVRLTAETLGVVLQAISHSNRLLAKELEISSTNRIEKTVQDNANYQTFVDTHQKIEEDLDSASSTPLNSFGAPVNPGGEK